MNYSEKRSMGYFLNLLPIYICNWKSRDMFMWHVFLLTLALVGLSVLLLCVRILFIKGGKFSSKHVGQSQAMRERGIFCAQTQDRMAQMKK